MTSSTSAQWKLVPVEPTEEMLKPFGGRHAQNGGCHVAAYRAMLAASPSPAASPASPSGDAVREIETLVDEYDPKNSDWYFRRTVIREILARILSAIASDATPAPTSGSEDGPDLAADFFRMTPSGVHAALAKPASEPATEGKK